MEERELTPERPELESCPFCGGEAAFGNSFWEGVFVYCTSCGCQTDYVTDDKRCVAEQRAADLWNRRVGDADVGSRRKAAEKTKRAYKSILESEANDLELIASGLDRLKKE